MSSMSSVGSSASDLLRVLKHQHSGGGQPAAGGASCLSGALVGSSGGAAGLGGSALLGPAGSSPAGAVPGIGGIKLGPDMLAALLDIQEQAASTGVTPTDPTGKNRGASFAQRLFGAIDSSGDGQISKGELEAAFASTGRDPGQADALFARLDGDGDGSVSQNELNRALRHGHHHGGAMDALTSLGQMQSSESATNADGSETTTITYANGTKVTITVPASAAQGGASSGTTPPAAA